MDFSEDWKSHFPVSPSHAPLLAPDSTRPMLGPLIFNPNPQTLTQLFSSSSLLPPPIHTHQLSLPQFLANSPGSSIAPSIASSIALQFGSQFQPQDELLSALHYNQLETLKYRNGVLLFFPTGENFERVGYLVLHIEGSDLRVKLDGNNDIFQVSSGVSQRISRILINPIDDGNESCIIGYLLVSTCYAVHWFLVCDDSYFERPHVVHKGSKTFKTCSVVHACWSPHIFQESVVLLKSGDLFLFDLSDDHIIQAPTNFKGTKLKINWPDSTCSKDAIWVSCEFSWHARILIVATSHMILLVDCRDDTCIASCLLKIELLHVHTQAQNEHFLALSRAGPDNFYFTVASNNFLLLCDVRKPMMPIIRWAHDLDNPTYINVVNLFQLRSHSCEDTFESVSKAGFCIMLGSFYNGIFNFFCYGPFLPSKEGSFASKFSKTNKSFYAWELPYEVAISGHYCHCGSCLLTEELSKQDLPEWVDWRTKKDMVLGFTIMRNHLASLLCEPDEYGGFTLLRLMTSGKIELQRYQASWLTEKKLRNCNGQGMLLNKYLFSIDDEKCELSKSHVFLKLKYLFSYFRGDFTKLLVRELEGIEAREKKSLDIEVHEALCKKLNACGVGSSRSSRTIFKDVEPSASLYEIALRRLWVKLPLDILQMAFSNNPEYSASSMEFLAVPPLNKLPPFFLRKPSPRSNKCSKKVKGSSDKIQHNYMVGPILPLAFLLGLHEFYYGSSNVSLETKVSLQCEKVMKVAGKICVPAHDFAASPDDGAGGKWVDSSRPRHFLSYQPILFDRPSTDLHRNFTDQYKIHRTLISNVLEKKTGYNEKFKSMGQGSSTELSSNSPNGKFGQCDARMYNLLESHMSKW